MSDEEEKAPEGEKEQSADEKKQSATEPQEKTKSREDEDEASVSANEQAGDKDETRATAESESDIAENEREDAEPSDGATGEESDAKESAAPGQKRREGWRETLVWAVGILIVLGVELYIYGHHGDIQVCVGVRELTNFELRDVPRTKENAKHHPFCAKRLNLGMWSSSEEQSQAALNDACNQAARYVGNEHRHKCLRNDDPWTRYVEREQIMPWDPRLYRRLLWLE